MAKPSRDLKRSNTMSLSSEAYRQALVRDGERRYREWHQNYHNYQARSAQQHPTNQQRPTKPWISSEAYRQFLVKDGERRFAEWHGQFLDYQRQFLASQST